jgi:L-alanine-DL-glutamate epimerase-like enolase superfamily enzyme
MVNDGLTLHTPAIEWVRAHAFRFPTDAPETDGTSAWDATAMVIVHVEAGAARGMGYSYVDAAAAGVINSVLSEVIIGADPCAIPMLWSEMVGAVRNIGWRGIAACAISAVDVALWDLKARLVGLPLAALLGMERQRVPVYGSGGFTSYPNDRLREQLGGWVWRDGCRAVEMKVGRDPEQDVRRVATAREAIGNAALFVDANGAYSRKQALYYAQRFDEFDVTWFEEPVSSDDLDGLRFIRDRAPAGMEIAAGEYGNEPFYFRRMLQAGAVDVLQADATRCGGYTGFLRAAALADAYGIPVSAHTAPALHLPVCCAAPRLRHMEWYHDHARIERTVFDGAPELQAGGLTPYLDRPGHGLEFKLKDAEQLAA